MEKTITCGCNYKELIPKAVQGEDGKFSVVKVPEENPRLKVWIIKEGDVLGVKEKPKNTFLVHECKNLVVYQETKGLTRYFNSLK